MRRVVLAAVLALTAQWELNPRRADAMAPTAVRFEIAHSDCAGAGAHHFVLFVNETPVATVPTTGDCNCHTDALTVTLTDPAVLALVDSTVCNSARVVSPDADFTLKIAWVRVSMDVAGTTVGTCLYDGSPWNTHLSCAVRSTCAAPGQYYYQTDIGGPDADHDGVPGGFGTGCDNCPAYYDPTQADADGDGVGDGCDNCP